MFRISLTFHKVHLIEGYSKLLTAARCLPLWTLTWLLCSLRFTTIYNWQEVRCESLARSLESPVTSLHCTVEDRGWYSRWRAPELWEVGAHSAISGLSSDSVSVSLRPLPPRPRQQLLVRWPGEDRGWSAWERVQPTLVTDSEWTQPSDEQREHHYTALSMCYSHTVISSYGLDNSFHSTFSNQKVYIQSENSLWYGVLVYPVLQSYV